MPDTVEIIGALIDRLPPEAKASTEAQQIVAAAVAAGIAAATGPAPSPVRVQRVDEYQSPGVYLTSFEVVDARIPKGGRIVRTFPANGRAQPAIDAAYAAARAHAISIAPISGGAYVYAAVDTDEPWHDTDAEQMGNAALYNVISGCAATPDVANLTVDLAAGAIVHAGSPIQVAAATDAWTLVADGSNERWTALTVGSAGTAVLVSGDPAASSSVEPSKPEIGDRVLIAFYKVQAAQTIAANCEYQLDKRLPNPQGLIGYSGTATSTTSTTAVDLVTISKLAMTDSIPTDWPLRIRVNFRKQALAANAVGFGLKINSTIIQAAAVATGNIRSSATNQAENGWFEYTIMPRSSANYLSGLGSIFFCYRSTDGAITTSSLTDAASASGPVGYSAQVPNAAITSIIIEAINGTASNAAEVTAVFVYRG